MYITSKALDIVKYLWYNKSLMDKYHPMNEVNETRLTMLGINEGNENVRS